MIISYIQFAKDYDFKNSLKISRTSDINSDEIEKFLKSSEFKGLCFEAFISDFDNEYVIGFSNNDQDSIDFINSCLKYLDDIKLSQTYIEKIKLETPNLIRVGIIDYWFENGPCLLWKKGDTHNITKELILERLKEYPQILKTDLNYQGISFYFSKEDTGLEHWMMIRTGKKVDSQYQLDIEKIVEYCRRLNY